MTHLWPKIVALLAVQMIDATSTQHYMTYPHTYETNPYYRGAHGIGSFMLRAAVLDTVIVVGTRATHNPKMTDAALDAMIGASLKCSLSNNNQIRQHVAEEQK